MRVLGLENGRDARKAGLNEGEAIIHPWINKAVEKAQVKVEARNFEIRKQLLKYDDVMNDQRRVIFDQRKDIMRSENVHDTVVDMRHEAAAIIVERAIPENSYHDQWHAEQLRNDAQRVLGVDVPIADWFAEDGIAETEIEERLINASNHRMAEKAVRLAQILCEWRKILFAGSGPTMERTFAQPRLTTSGYVRAYAQKDPLNEYKREAFLMFSRCYLACVKPRVWYFRMLNCVPIRVIRSDHPIARHQHPLQKIARNAPCPCRSGKKYKHCCGAIVA